MTITVVIPAYNEASTIADIIHGVRRYVDNVVVVDDGSTDGTSERLEGLPVTLLRHQRNLGKGASLWNGMQHARSRGAAAVITIDADGQHRPEDIPRLLSAAVLHPGSLIIAARLRHRQRVPGARQFASFMADFWISWAAGCPIADTQSGFRLYPADLIGRLAQSPRDAGGFVFESEVLIEAARQGWEPLAVPIDAIYPPFARPSYYQPFDDTARIVRMVAWKLLSRGMHPQGLLKSLRHPPLVTTRAAGSPSGPD